MTGFVLLRVRAHRLLLAAALLTVLLTTCVLATFTAFTGAIGDAALRRTLQHQAAGRSTVEVQADEVSGGTSALDTAVRKELRGSFAGLPAKVAGSTRSGPYGLPASLHPGSAPKGGDPDLTLLATFDRSRVELLQGGWPAPAASGARRVQVAVPQTAAQVLKLAPGAVVRLADRLGGPALTVQVTGIFRPRDPASPYWHLDPLDGRGVHTVSFTTYGPLLADPGSFGSGRVAAAAMSWQATGDFRTAGAHDMDALEDSVHRTLTELHDNRATAATEPSSDLPALIDALRRSMLVTRSTLLIGALQLVILAAFALLLVAGLLAEERAGETALLRARGGSRGRVAWLAAWEALLLAVPAALVAPLLAGPVTRLLAGTGAMARTGVSLGSGSTGTAWLVALAAAVVCAGTVIAPALRTGGSYATERAARSRRGGVPGAVQAGADLGLLVIAGVAYWQLHRRASGGGALSTNAGGGLGVDPVLVAAPALCLLAGTVLVLRLLPLVAKLGESRAARGRSLPLALAGWQLARRPRRGAGAALLLVLAVAMGMFAIGQSASWDRSQRDQAQFEVGADLRVTGMTTPPFGQPGIYASVPDLSAAAPASRTSLVLDQDRTATALAIDTAQAAKAMRFRSDLTGGRSAAEVLAPLHKDVKAPGGGLALPAGAQQVTFEVALRRAGGTAVATPGDYHAGVTVLDSQGVPYAFDIGNLRPDGAPHPLVFDIAALSGPAGGAPAGPLRMIGFDLTYPLTAHSARYTVTISSARAAVRGGGVRPLAAGSQPWTATSSIDDPTLDGLPNGVRPSADGPRLGGGALMSLSYDAGAVRVDPRSYGQVPSATLHAQAGAADPPALAAVATDAFLKAQRAKVGDHVSLSLGGINVPVRVTGAVRAIPGLEDDGTDDGSGPGSAGGASFGDGPDGSGSGTASGPGADGDVGGVLVDLRAVNQYLLFHGGQTMEPSEWWLAARPGDTAKAAAALRARADVDTVLVADEAADDLRSDPLGAGPQSALPAAVVAAVVLAALGFAVSAAGAVRERTAEFAILRALGASRRKLARVVAVEQGLLVLVSLLVGVALGALLTRLVTPLIVLTPQAAKPTPALLVRLPAGRLLELLGAVVVVPVLVVLAAAARRGDPASALRRQGED